MTKKLKKFFALSLCAAMLLSLFACSQNSAVNNADENPAGDKLKVVCTLFPQYDFVRQIAGDAVELTLLLPPGVESHSYDPTPADIKAVTTADLVIRISAEMETWSEKLFGSSSGNASFLDLAGELGAVIENRHLHKENDHSHNDVYFSDPHIWTDPLMACEMVEIITEKLCELDAANSLIYKENSQKYIAQIEALDTEIKTIVQNSERSTLIFSGRFALRNFTARYNLDVISALDACADNSEPSAATVAEIVKSIEDKDIKVVFYEELIEPKTAKIICDETGTKMLLFHSCHNLTKDEFNAGESYLSLMKQNTKNLEEALK